MKYSFLAITLMFTIQQQVCTANNNASVPQRIPDKYISLEWSDSTLWYNGGQLQSSIKESCPDVFYLLPVCIMTGKDNTGSPLSMQTQLELIIEVPGNYL